MKNYLFLFSLILIVSLGNRVQAAYYSWNEMVYTDRTVPEMLQAILTTDPEISPGAEFIWNGKVYNDETVAKLITVITTTNPIPSIPSTKHIYPTQKSLFRIPAFARCKKIIVFDGIQPSFEARAADYEQYKQAIFSLTQTDPYFSNTELVFCEKWVHLSGAVREAMAHVTTPYVFMHQHDFVLGKDFELNGIIATMEANSNIQYVLLAHPPNIQWLPNEDIDEIVIGPSFVPLLRHYSWSDNDHVATTEYYREFILPKCGHGPMEGYVQPMLRYYLSVVGNACQPPFGTYLYGNLSDGQYLYHSNGQHE